MRSARPLLARSLALLVALSGLWGADGEAAPPPITVQAGSDDSPPTSPGIFGFVAGIDRSQALLGDMWGLRSTLADHGMTLTIQDTSEYIGNVSGGVQQGFVYEGLTQVVGQMDTMRAFGHYGGLFNISGLNIRGSNLSAENLLTLQTASGIEADPGTRLWEAWYDQKFLDEDRLDVKIGQQSLDQEFMVSTNALYFVNTMFGWPMLPSADLPGGGPAYPLSALGVRLSARPVNGVTLLAGVFNGDPVKNDDGSDPQQQNRHGVSFPLNGGALYIAEAQFSYPAVGSMVEPGQQKALGWTYRIGAWYDTRNFADMRLDQNGIPLANPSSSGVVLQHAGNYAFYGVADRLVWRDDEYPDRTIAVFTRIMGTPQQDRNLIDFSANLGAVMHSPFRNRPGDTFGIGAGFARLSQSVRQADLDNIVFSGQVTPVRSNEKFIELTYQYQWKPWIQIQPDLQYVWNPGGGVSDPDYPWLRIKNECVIGIRTNISF
jgi:porin